MAQVGPTLSSRTTIQVCRGTSCASQHGRALLQDIEELCAGRADVVCEPRRCMGQCGHGPNVQVTRAAGPPQTISGIRSYDLAEKCAMACAPGLRIAGVQRKVARLKFAARRESDGAQRRRLIADAFGALGGEAEEKHPRLMSELLILRARDALVAAAAGMRNPHGDEGGLLAALEDAERAAALAPEWRSAHVVVGDVLEAMGRPRGFASVEDDGIPELQQWVVASSRRLNHNCVLMELDRCEDVGPMRASDTFSVLGDVWHVDVAQDGGEGGTSGSGVLRSYTPKSSHEDYRQGKLELLVKEYATGMLSPHLCSLTPGRFLQISPPLATMDAGSLMGVFVIAGGSAVTVALQLCAAVLRRHPRRGKARMVLCNHTVEDVVLRDKMEWMLAHHSGMRILHCISEGQLPPSGRRGQAMWRMGRLSAAMLEGFGVEPHLRAVISGPAGLCSAAAELVTGMGLGAGEEPIVLDAVPAVLEDTPGVVSEELGNPEEGEQLENTPEDESPKVLKPFLPELLELNADEGPRGAHTETPSASAPPSPIVVDKTEATKAAAVAVAATTSTEDDSPQGRRILCCMAPW